MSELQVSVEVKERQSFIHSSENTWEVWLRTNNRQSRIVLMSTGHASKAVAERAADRWRVALRNIDGPETAVPDPIRWCPTHHDFVLTHTSSGEDQMLCSFAWHLTDPPDEPCPLVPLFFRDIKDEPEGKE